MKDRNKKKTIVLLIVWIVLLVAIPFVTVKTQDFLSSNNHSYISSDFDIEEYNVVLDVDKDNKVDVTEKITINIPSGEFNGIYKSIPLWEKYYNKDLKESKKKVYITNLRVIGEKYVLDKFNDRIGIRIGSTRTNVEKGLHTYTIKYRYNMGKDPNSNFDEFVFNLFDNYDNTKINNMTVTVNMPKNFDNNVMFFDGSKNITNKVDYQINGNSMLININNYVIDSSLTLNLTLPNDYFVIGTYNYGILCLLICISIIIISIGSYIAWKRYSTKTDKRSQTVEFYAPDDLDSAQVGYIYGEKNIKKLTVALIIQLASKGYISIEEKENKKYNIVNIGKSKTNLKPLSITEQLVYQELFKNGDSNLLSNDYSFSAVFAKVSNCLENVIDKKIHDNNSKKMMNTISTLLVISIVAWMVAYLFIRDLDPKLEIMYIISFIAIFITGFFSIFMNQKNNYGQIIIAKVLGFRNYLITAEKNQLEALVSKNPDYFYDILPYTYVLDISNKWINNFDKNNIRNIDIDSLNYYESNLFMIMSE